MSSSVGNAWNREHTCPACGHYDWGHDSDGACTVMVWGEKGIHVCDCKNSSLADGRRVSTGSSDLRSTRGLASRLLLGLCLRYYAVCDFVNDLARRF